VLYHTDPSGTYVKYKCMAIGSGSEGALTALQEHYKPEMTLAEAEVLALSTLKQVMEEKVRGRARGARAPWAGGPRRLAPAVAGTASCAGGRNGRHDAPLHRGVRSPPPPPPLLAAPR
jgi:hypothetical protein